MDTILIQLLVLPLAISAASLTLTKGKIFRTPRMAISKRSSFLRGLFSCPYCMSHWLSALIVLIMPWEVITALLLPDFLIWVLYYVGVSALISGLIMRLIQFSDDEDPTDLLMKRLTDQIRKMTRDLAAKEVENESLREELKNRKL